MSFCDYSDTGRRFSRCPTELQMAVSRSDLLTGVSSRSSIALERNHSAKSRSVSITSGQWASRARSTNFFASTR